MKVTVVGCLVYTTGSGRKRWLSRPINIGKKLFQALAGYDRDLG